MKLSCDDAFAWSIENVIAEQDHQGVRRSFVQNKHWIYSTLFVEICTRLRLKKKFSTNLKERVYFEEVCLVKISLKNSCYQLHIYYRSR